MSSRSWLPAHPQVGTPTGYINENVDARLPVRQLLGGAAEASRHFRIIDDDSMGVGKTYS